MSYQVEILSIISAGDYRIFRIEKPEGFTFSPGQFVKLSQLGGKLFRAYSIASSPDMPYLEFLIKKAPGGKFTEGYLWNLSPGDKLGLEGPYGVHTYKSGEIVLVGGGSGLAPLMSVIRHSKDRVYLFQSFRQISSSPYLSEIITKPNVKAYITFTREERAGFLSGRFSHDIIRGIVERESISKGLPVFICGSRPFAQDMKKVFQDLGFSEFMVESW